MQVGPIKHTLKPPGTRRLKLECDELLSSFAFNFNLRRYNKAVPGLRAGPGKFSGGFQGGSSGPGRAVQSPADPIISQ